MDEGAMTPLEKRITKLLDVANDPTRTASERDFAYRQAVRWMTVLLLTLVGTELNREPI
jgi:hypothetical protein